MKRSWYYSEYVIRRRLKNHSEVDLVDCGALGTMLAYTCYFPKQVYLRGNPYRKNKKEDLSHVKRKPTEPTKHKIKPN